MNILPGSRIFGESGNCLLVDRVEGEILVCGDRRIKFSAVVKIEPPPTGQTFHIGDRRIKFSDVVRVEPPINPIYYIGHKWQKQYGGMPLKLHPELRDGSKRCFIMPDGYLTTWLEISEVRES